MIPLSVPSIKGNEWKYIKECLDSEWVSSAGKYVELFEDRICDYTGANKAVAMVNGTSALQVALRLVGVKAGDAVVVPTLTFIAPVNAVAYNNAEPIFMDCDAHYNLDIEKTIRFIEQETVFRDGNAYHRKTNRRIAAIVPVHIFGNAVDLAPLLPICKTHHIKIVEDASESLGTCYTEGVLSGRYAGTVGDIGCYSFNGNKIITCGGGGMLVTNHSEYAEQAKYLTTQAKDDDVFYIHNDIGYNFRLTNIQAAMGVAQLEQLNDYIKIKKKNYEAYRKAVDNIAGLQMAGPPAYAASNYWFYSLQIDGQTYGKDRDELMRFLSDHKIQTRPVWHLNHLQRPYAKKYSYHIEKAFELLDITLNIPCSVNLTEADLDRVTAILHQ